MQAAVAAFFISLTPEAIHGSLVFFFQLHRPTVQLSCPPRTQSLLLPQSHPPRLRTAPPNHPRRISLVFALPQASSNAARTGHPDVEPRRRGSIEARNLPGMGLQNHGTLRCPHESTRNRYRTPSPAHTGN